MSCTVSATDQQASAFLYWQYGATVKDLSHYDKIKAVTITLRTNANGYPLKFTVTGQSAIVRLAISETFSCNRPVSIKAP